MLFAQLAQLPPPRNLAEFKARQAQLLALKRQAKAARLAYAQHVSTLKPTRFQAKAGKREHKHEELMRLRHQESVGPRSPYVPKPGHRKFRFVPGQAGQQIQLRK
jgi:hypothetical protein